jgi:hypothetical protein
VLQDATEVNRPLVEIGVIIAGPLDDVDRQAATLAIEQTKEFLARTFSGFRFTLLLNRRPELAGEGRVQPSVLLQQAAEDRDARHWDFAFVLTASELVGQYSPFCFSALSRPLDAAVISLSLIDPQTTSEEAQIEARVARIAERTSRLLLHALGHLTGLSAHEDSLNLLFHPAIARDIDAMGQFDPEQLQLMRAALTEIADQRLEEMDNRQVGKLSFLLHAAWINRREIIEAIVGAKPWEFPRRLSRLTIASVSTIAILFMTAESWDLALSQTSARVLVLATFSLTLTSLYVVIRQQLLVRRGRHHTEQTVVTSASAFGIVMIGMLVTWVTLLLIGIGFSWLLFDPALIASWASSSHLNSAQVGFTTTIQMSCFSASLGLLIGALGASFESQNYFRHIIFVDEEV